MIELGETRRPFVCTKCGETLGYSYEDYTYLAVGKVLIYHSVRLICLCGKSKTFVPADCEDLRTQEQIDATEFVLSKIGSAAREINDFLDKEF